ncbi:ABC-F family ATP-binding cassette domain-containing protein [Paraburkholderia saeva]|uniref:ABC transporter ATP-binding protein YheS n=1 Tax=Paraburkholderia saeva TaxID=2777537 RepID=A0A9N8X031_9BURK|nr:ABC-F family ATP-binding cassette domain-containing protein [Paraburkholderia saeva]CAG4889744.1 putative ABC transporter ATP-binding protein YheS [Paraburkholderia saeva]
MTHIRGEALGVLTLAPSAFAHGLPPATAGFSISLRQVTVTLPDGRTLLHELNETFQRERTGLLGRNGTGKSVLASVLVGLVKPDAGQIARHGMVAYVPQEIVPGKGATVADVAGLTPILNALDRMEGGEPCPGDFDLLDGRWNIRSSLEQALTESGLAHLQPQVLAGSLSGGELTRVALIGAFLSEAEGLVLDEPTNHLDCTARQWLRDKLLRWTGGLILVSHDRDLLDMMERIVELNPGGIRNYGGNYALYVTQRSAEASAAQASLERARTERNAAERALRRQHNAQQRRAAHQAKGAKNANLPGIALGRRKDGAEAFAGRERLRQHEAQVKLDEAVHQAARGVEPDKAVALVLPATAIAAGKRVIHLEDAVAPFPVNSPPLTMTLTGPVRVAVTGPNGCGKTTLLKMLAGSIAPVSGVCQTGVRSAWLDQQATRLLPPRRSVLERLHELKSPLPDGVLRSHLSLLGLNSDLLHLPSAALSGGERLKGALACVLWSNEPAQLLLLDEPTNHVDLESIDAIEQALGNYPGALVLVSHDIHFLRSLRLTHRLESDGKQWQLIAM